MCEDIYFLGMSKEKMSYHYKVVGTTKNIYTVKIKNSIRCNCPDHFSLCKHACFILFKVLKKKKDFLKTKVFDKEDHLIIKNSNINKIVDKELLDSYNNNCKFSIEQREEDCIVCFNKLLEGV